MASDYGSSDPPQPLFMHIFNKVFMLFHDNLTFCHFYFVPCAPPMPPSSPSPSLPILTPLPFLQEALEVLVASRLNGSSARDVVRMDSQFSLASERVIRRQPVYCFIGLEQGLNM